MKNARPSQAKHKKSYPKKLKTIPKFVGGYSRRNKTKNAINKANKIAAAAARKTKNLKSNTE